MAYDLSDNVIFIHPSVWIIDNKMKNKTFEDCREYVRDRLFEIELLNANKIFNIGLFVPCSITYLKRDRVLETSVIDKLGKKEYYTKNIEDIEIGDKVLDAYGNTTTVTKLFIHDVSETLQSLTSKAICGKLVSTKNHPF